MPTRAERVRENMRAHRRRRREAGLRQVQYWVPDTSSPEVVAELRREAEILAAAKDSPEEREVMDWIAENFDDSGWS